MRIFAALALVVALVVLSPAALAQERTPVLLERVDDGVLLAKEDEPARAMFRLFNLNPDDDFYVSVRADAPLFWAAGTPEPFFLAPRASANVTIEVAPEPAASGDAEVEVTFSLVHGRTGEALRVSETLEVRSAAPPRVLGIIENPLSPPLDNAWGTFILNMLFWGAFGIGAVVLEKTIVRILTARASNSTTRVIGQKLQKPVFFFVLLLGLASSIAVLPNSPVLAFIERFLVAIAVIVFGLYVLYRLLDAALTYYQREVSRRTRTRVDDVLIPVLRKVGLVVIYVAGAILTLQQLGWDPTLIFAGAGIAGLVIAFAAQDTISNLFSGIFLMVDQPFHEGDDIRLESGDVARVESIGLRTTRLYLGKNHEIIVVPNNQLSSNRVVNLTGPDKHYWMMVNVGVAYDSDTEKVRRVLMELALADERIDRGGDWEPLVMFSNFGESSLDFVLRFAVRDYRLRFAAASDMRFKILAAFEREGIEIPFPQRVVHLKEEAAPAPG